MLGHFIVSLRGVKATKQSPKFLLRRLPRADALAMTTFGAITLVQNFAFIVKWTSILSLGITDPFTFGKTNKKSARTIGFTHFI